MTLISIKLSIKMFNIIINKFDKLHSSLNIIMTFISLFESNFITMNYNFILNNMYLMTLQIKNRFITFKIMICMTL